MQVGLTRSNMNELYPEQMAALKNVDLPNGAHHFALETRNNQLSFESFGDGKRYVWNHGADRWEPAE